jgi:S1-C subfamily serine protease
MSTESETTSPPVIVRNLPALRREAIVPSSDRARLAAILATCSLAGLSGGLALSMVAGAQQASASMRASRQAAMREQAPLTWLGLQIVDACQDQRCDGARIKRVIPGSPAHRAGFRQGDVVLRFDDDHVGSADELILAVRASSIDTPVDIAVRRGAAETVLQPTLGAMPANIRAQVEPRY